ncbi:unnamed protein product [Penicillium salamii]|uniref:MYND-type domain-containing protein n=1 Tax=Penicillium salamii TaxID=1612424 RepID=A0A9W4NJI5_9EURO|nr:unnamed protein product [Penicillium salamii]
MLAPVIANLVQFFYPIGNTPAVSLTQDLPPKEKADILLLGCGDLRHILFTINNEQEVRDQRQLDFTCCDVDTAVIARNVLLLSLILDDVEGANEDTIWNLFYHFRIDKSSLDLLQSQTAKLLSLSESLDSWHQSQYGSHVKICDGISLERVRGMWGFYGAKREGNDLSAYKTKVESGIRKSQEYKKAVLGGKGGNVVTSARAAAPACLDAMSDLGGLYNDYWEFGTTDSDPKARSDATEYNPMFTPQDGNMFLHYGIDPLSGFHLGAAYVPVKAPSPLANASPQKPTGDDIVWTARNEFSSWMQSFRSHCAAGLVKLRFFVGDAVALAYALQHVRSTGSSKQANWYRDRYHFEPLELNDEEYANGSAPCVFDIIDTSNLIDHLGALNMLVATSPLLRNTFSATLFSEKLVKTHGNHKELLENILCGDLTTVSSLLGLTPVEVVTNAASFSSGDEALVMGSSKTGTQLFARIAWKRPMNPSAAAEKSLSLIHFDPAHLANALLQIYLQMFADEDVTQLLASMNKKPISRPSVPTYHRASFVALLCLVKSRVKTDWNQMMTALLALIDGDERLAFSHTYTQELNLWTHMMGLYSVDILRNPPSALVGSQGSGILQQWQNIPEVVSVTLEVPRDRLDPFIKESMKKGFTSAIQGTLQSSPQSENQWQNMFAATQVAFGSLDSKGAQSSDLYELEIHEDELGWSGRSSMFVSFYVPSWILLQESQTATVSLSLPHSPHTVAAFASTLGQSLSVFTTEQRDSDHVHITKTLPNQSEVISIDGFAPGVAKNEVDPQGNSESTVTASVDNSGHISSFTSHVQILSEETKKILQEGSKVMQSMRSPFNYTLYLERGPKYTANFPAPVLGSTAKIRVARKSSFLELVADVAKSNDWPNLQSFMYPVYLDSGSPAVWNMPHLNIASLPKIDLSNTSSERLNWLKYHLPTMWSSKESALKFNPSLPATPNLRAKVEFKDSLYHMFMGFTGVQGNHASVFAINCAEERGVQMLFFLSGMRLDLSNRTPVLDAAVLPLRLDLMESILPSLQAIQGSSYAPAAISTPKSEVKLWKESLPAWSERSRSWSHKSSCEYLSRGVIPVSTGFGERILCSCGEGKLPKDFMPDFPGWKGLSKYAVRVSVSPAFTSALVESPLDLSGSGFTAKPPGEEGSGCQVCGTTSNPDGLDLMNCSRCHTTKYCSRDCQKKDWKQHKLVCKA